MPALVNRHQVQDLLSRGAQLAEVLPQREYEWAHLPGAVHLPLARLAGGEEGHVLERGKPVVVYCNDFQ